MIFREIDAMRVCIGLALITLAVLGEHCLSSVYREPPPAPDAGHDSGHDATIDTEQPPPVDDPAMADASSVDCAAYPWCGSDFCDPDATIPLECWPLPDITPPSPWGPGKPGRANFQ